MLGSQLNLSHLAASELREAGLNTVSDSSNVLGTIAFWALVVTSAAFLPYTLVFVSGDEPAIRNIVPGALDKAADAGQYLIDHLALWQLHATNAVLYVCATPIQFLPAIRKRCLSVHRAFGYIFLLTGTTLAVSGLVMAPLSEFPGFVPPSMGLAGAWVVCGGVALWKIKEKRVQEHREWMIRAAAAGYSSVLTRAMVPAVHLVAGVSYRDAGCSALWLSLLIMLVGTEVYLQSRRQSRIQVAEDCKLIDGDSKLTEAETKT